MVDGKEVKIKDPRHALALGVIYLPEDRQKHGLLMPMSVAHNMTLAVLDRISRAAGSGAGERLATYEYVERLRIVLRA